MGIYSLAAHAFFHGRFRNILGRSFSALALRFNKYPMPIFSFWLGSSPHAPLIAAPMLHDREQVPCKAPKDPEASCLRALLTPQSQSLHYLLLKNNISPALHGPLRRKPFRQLRTYAQLIPPRRAFNCAHLKNRPPRTNGPPSPPQTHPRPHAPCPFPTEPTFADAPGDW